MIGKMVRIKDEPDMENAGAEGIIHAQTGWGSYWVNFDLDDTDPDLDDWMDNELWPYHILEFDVLE